MQSDAEADVGGSSDNAGARLVNAKRGGGLEKWFRRAAGRAKAPHKEKGGELESGDDDEVGEDVILYKSHVALTPAVQVTTGAPLCGACPPAPARSPPARTGCRRAAPARGTWPSTRSRRSFTIQGLWPETTSRLGHGGLIQSGGGTKPHAASRAAGLRGPMSRARHGGLLGAQGQHRELLPKCCRKTMSTGRE